MAIYYGQVGSCLWSYFHAQAPTEMWAGYIAQAHRYYDWLAANALRGGVITFTWRAMPLNAKQRKELASLITAPNAKHVAAHVMVTDSRPVQMVLKAMDWFVKKPYPEQVFVDPRAALDWIQQYAALDRSALVKAVVRAVPAAQLDPAFGRDLAPGRSV